MMHIKMKRPAGAHKLHPHQPVSYGTHTHPNFPDHKTPTRPMRPKRPGPTSRAAPRITAQTNPVYEILKKM